MQPAEGLPWVHSFLIQNLQKIIMAELWSEPPQDIIPGLSSRNPVNTEEGHSCMAEFSSTVFSSRGLKSTAIQQNLNK